VAGGRGFDCFRVVIDRGGNISGRIVREGADVIGAHGEERCDFASNLGICKGDSRLSAAN
tara:strand:- start:31 stop:210 length:180 start_codon:yes stop_codon:yes gene_type:complete